MVRLDPAASARSSLGPAAYGEYERVFGPRIVARWPQHLVLDGLDTIELLLDAGNLTIHPRCMRLKEAFGSYCHKRERGQWIDFPADGHPEEDMRWTPSAAASATPCRKAELSPAASPRPRVASAVIKLNICSASRGGGMWLESSSACLRHQTLRPAGEGGRRPGEGAFF